MAKSPSASGRKGGVASVPAGKVINLSTPQDTQRSLDAIARLVGKESMTFEQVAALIGLDAPGVNPGATIDMRTSGGITYLSVRGTTEGGGRLTMNRQFHNDGIPRVYNEYFKISGGAAGTGGDMFTRQVENLAAAGFKRMDVTAAGDGAQLTRTLASARARNPNISERQAVSDAGILIGYNAWANLGYTGSIPNPSAASAAFPALRGKSRIDVQEVLGQPGGKEWWKANGGGFHGVFDLTPGSANRKILETYNKDRGRKKK